MNSVYFFHARVPIPSCPTPICICRMCYLYNDAVAAKFFYRNCTATSLQLKFLRKKKKTTLIDNQHYKKAYGIIIQKLRNIEVENFYIYLYYGI